MATLVDGGYAGMPDRIRIKFIVDESLVHLISDPMAPTVRHYSVDGRRLDVTSQGHIKIVLTDGNIYTQPVFAVRLNPRDQI